MFLKKIIERIAPKNGAIRDSAVLSAANIFQYVMTSITGILVAKLLSPHDYGVKALVFSIVNVFKMVAGFGLSRAALKFGSEKGAHSKDYVTTALVGFLASGIIILFGFVIAAGPLSRLYGEASMNAYIILMALSLLLQFPQVLAINWLIEGKINRYACVVAVQGIFYPLIILATTWAWGLNGVFFGFLIYMLLASWVYILPKPTLGRFRWGLLKKMAGYGVLTSGSVFLTYALSTYDKMILGVYISKESLAHYALAFTFITVLTLVPMSVQQVIFPRLSNLFSKKKSAKELKRIFWKMTKYTLAYGVLAAAGVIIIVHFLLKWFLTKYLPAETFLLFLAIPIILETSIETSCNTFLATANRLVPILRIQGAQLLVGIVVCLALSPIIGVWSAVIALWVLHIVGGIFYFASVKRLLSSKH